MKLNNVQRYAIQGMSQNNKTVAEIAKELEIPEKDVQTYLNKIKDSLAKVAANKKSDRFVKTTQSGKKLGGAIMTKSASESGDNFEKTAKPKNWDSKVFKIREE